MLRKPRCEVAIPQDGATTGMGQEAVRIDTKFNRLIAELPKPCKPDFKINSCLCKHNATLY
jgi:hypothetical protein